MILFKLFYTFFKLGLFTFGGGYAMIPLISDAVIANGWLSEEQFLNIIAVAESTPGPVAINVATFVGSTQGGVAGSICATFGVVLPSFIIIVIIAGLLQNFLKFSGVRGFMSGVRPCVAALIIAAGIKIGLNTLFSVTTVGSGFSPNFVGIVIFALVAVISMSYKRIKDKKISPIVLIVISAALGVLICAVGERVGIV